MKRFIAAVLFFSMNMSIASAAKVTVQEVGYDEETQGFTVIAGVANTCNANLSFRLRGCTDLVVPYTCFVDVKAEGGESCGEDSMAIGQVYLDQLNLIKKEMSGGTIVFQNEKGKTRKTVKLTNFLK